MEENGKLYFGAGLDTSQLKRDVAKAAELFDEVGKEAAKAGAEADAAFDDTGRKVKKTSKEVGDEVKKQAENAKESVKSLTDSVGKETNSIKESLSGAAKYIGAMFSVQALAGFARSVVSVRSEIESLEASFRTLAGEQAGGALFNQIKEFATTTPMLMQDLAKGAQTLLAFNIPAEQVMTTLRQIGDISMGDSQKFNSLVLSFAQMTSAGKLMGQDLMQMINAGFNPLSEISEKTGKSIGVLKDEMSKGAISVDMVKEAFASATSKGGKFYGMLETQSKTIKGSLSNLQGAWDDMLNSIGEQTQGVLISGISAAQSAVQNWQTYVQILMSVIAAYGTYKAVLMSVVVAEKARNLGASIQLFMTLRKELGLATAAQQAFNLSVKANPYVAVASVLATVVGLLTAFAFKTKEASEAEQKLEAATANVQGELLSEKQKLDQMFDTLNKAKKGTKEYQAAKDNIVQNYGVYFQGLDAELERVGGLQRAYDSLTLSVQKSVVERGMQSLQEQNMQNLGAAMDKALSKLQDWLSKATEERRTALIAQVRDYILTGAGMTKGTFVAQLKEAGGNMWQSIYEARKVQTGNLNAEAKYRERYEGLITKPTKLTPNIESTPTAEGKVTERVKRNVEKETSSYIDLALKQQQERVRAAEDAELAVRQAKIDASNKSTDEQIKQLEINRDKELLANSRALEDYQTQMENNAKSLFEADPDNNGKEWNGVGIIIDPKVVQSYTDQAAQITAKYAAEIADLRLKDELDLADYTSKYGEYEQRRAALITLYEAKIKSAQNEGQRKTLSAELTQALADLDAEGNKATNAVSKMFADMTDKSIAELRKLANEGERALNFLSNGEYNADTAKELGITKEQFELWSKSPEKLAEIKKALEQLRDSADALENPLKKINNAFNKIFNSGKDTKKLSDGINDLLSGLQSVGTAVNFASQSLSQLGNALGSGALGAVGDVLGEVGNVTNSIASGAQAGAMFGPWGAAAGAALGAITSVTSAISKWIDAAHERKIQRLQDQIDALSKSYDNLGDAVEKAFSGDAVKMYQQQNALLRQQKLLIQKQIQEEQSKKKTDKDRIKQWKEQLNEIDNMIKDNEEAAVNAIFGSDIKSAIEQFADAYADAFAKGEGRAKASKDLVKDMIAAMIKEAIKADFSAPMQKIRDALKVYFADGLITDYESAAIEQMVNAAMNDADKKYGWATKYLSDSTTQSTSSKGFQAMSQDTADELNGRFTSLQLNTEIIKTSVAEVSLNVGVMRSNVGEIMSGVNDLRTMSMQAIGHLESIVKNTKPIAEISENIVKIERNTRNI